MLCETSLKYFTSYINKISLLFNKLFENINVLHSLLSCIFVKDFNKYEILTYFTE